MTDKGVYRCYINKRFGEGNLALIGMSKSILEEYEAQGFQFTLRQLYYKLVARDVIENTVQSYNRLGGLISDARLAGLISWTSIEDRMRSLRGLNTWDTPEGKLQQARHGYRRDLWENQPYRPEVWVEKDAMSDVVGQICNELRVDFFACRGYVSQSEQWRAGKRHADYIARGQMPMIFHLGDHDPSGIDMTRDNRERLSMFAGTQISVTRLALNMNQVDTYKPPPNPAKVTDSRFEDYQKKFGDESWELDALEPKVIQDLIEGAVLKLRNNQLWQQTLNDEATDIQALNEMIDEVAGPEEK